MIKLEVSENIDRKWWNELVKSVGEGTVFQTTYWADYIEASGKGKPYYLIFRNNDCDVVSILLLNIENTLNKFKSIPGYISNKFEFGYLTWQKGPLIIKEGLSSVILEEIVSRIEGICIERNLVGIKNITLPLDYTEKKNTYNSLELVLEKRGFVRREWETSFLDLALGKEKIWESLGRHTKWDVRKGYKNQLEVVELQKGDLPGYGRLLAENMRRNKVTMPPHYPDHIMWNALKENGYDALHVIGAKKKDRIFAAVGLVEYNGIIFQIGSAQSDEAYFEKMNVNDVIRWETLLWGMNNNKRIYDLTGMASNPSDKHEAGIRKYKLKWSNKTVPYNMYTKAHKRFSHAALATLNKIYKGLNMFNIFNRENNGHSPESFSKFLSRLRNKWSTYAPASFWGDRIDSRFLAAYMIKDRKNKKIIDIGCNNGIVLSEIDKTNVKFGLDISDAFLKTAKGMNRDAFLLKGDISYLPFKDESFDCIVFLGMLELLPGENKKNDCIKEIARVLKENGELILTTPNRMSFRAGSKDNFVDYDCLVKVLQEKFVYQVYGFNPFPDFPYFLPNRVLARIPGIWKILLFMMRRGVLLRRCRSFLAVAHKA